MQLIGTGFTFAVLTIISYVSLQPIGEDADGGDTNDTRLVILDTDGGADDLLALIQLVEDTETNVLAVICTYGNVPLEQSCDNVLRTLNFIGRTDVPVFAGCERPLIADEIIVDGYFGSDGMSNASHLYPLAKNVTVQPKHGVFELLDLVNSYPQEVTLVNLGPLTNVALAMNIDFGFSIKLKDHIVGGATMRGIGNIMPSAEFNIYADVEAAATVFSRTAYPIRVVPFELCATQEPSWEWYDEWIATGTPKAIFIDRIFSSVNEKSRPLDAPFQACDLQATTVLLYPEVINSTTLRMAEVERCGTVTRGAMVVDYRLKEGDPNSNVEMVTGLNVDQLLEVWSDLVLDDILEDDLTTPTPSNSD